VTIVPKNRHIDAATAIVGSQLRAKALLNGLACKPSDTYMFLANGRKTYTESLLLLQNVGRSTTFLATSPQCTEQVQPVSQLIKQGVEVALKSPARLAQAIMGPQEPLLEEAFENAGFAPLHKKLAGVLLLTPLPEVRCIDITYLGASPHARGKGVGNSLVRKAYEVAQDSQYKRISLAVDAQNTPAIHLYQRWNFRKIGQRFTMIKKLF
jgi:ribosomal protein S18 acetylase RimI-like enzyme